MKSYMDAFKLLLNCLRSSFVSQQSSHLITRDHVVWAYRLFLDREPEAELVVQEKLNAFRTTQDLRDAFLVSQEFQDRNPIVRIKVDDPLNLPVPPGELITLVANNPDVTWYLLSGQSAAESIRDMLEKNRLFIDEFDAILDFGCGCGRVIRQWREAKASALYGTDYNPKLVEWCQENLGLAKFSMNDLVPPLEFEDARFDFVYALSVFTHLTEELNLAWIEEMSRIIKPSGHLLMTTHGESYLYRLPPFLIRRFHRDELAVILPEEAGSNQCGAYHPYKYVAERLAPAGGFKVIDFVPRGARGNPHQDVYLMQKRPHV